MVLDLGANIDCSIKNLVDFSKLGAALYRAVFKKDKPTVALLNIGSEDKIGRAHVLNSSHSQQSRMPSSA